MNTNENEYENEDEHKIETEIDDMEQLQTEWSERLELRRKDMMQFEDEAKRSLKWLRLNKDGRKAVATGERLNIAWANYEIMRTAVYSRPPQPVVVPKFGGGPMRQQMDAVAQVIERCIDSNNDRTDVHTTLEFVRDDLLKVGRGVAWVRYEAIFAPQPGPVIDEATGAPTIGADGQIVMAPQDVMTSEAVYVDHVAWGDYLEGKSTMWARVPWVARRVPFTRPAFKKRFGAEKITECGVSFEVEQSTSEKKMEVAGAAIWIWEIWCRESNKVYFMAVDAKKMLEVEEPLLKFDGFFPCPEPAMSCMEDGSRTPISEILMIEDQLVEVDALTKRINALRNSLKVRGFYGKGATATTAADEIERAVRSNDDRQVLIPVAAWAANGSGDLGIEWLPIEIVAGVIQQCTVMRKEAIELIYQVTGISDVMRGASDSSETLGAQQIKAQWGSVRVRDKQGKMVRMARDVCRMVAEVICERFQPQTIEQMAVYGFDQQMLELMRNDGVRGLVLDVETDSTIQPDEDADKQRRTEFLTAMSGLLSQAFPLGQAEPRLLPMLGEMVKFAAAGFRVGREMEKQIDAAMQALQTPPEPPPPAPPDPMVEAKTQAEMAKAEAIKAKAQADVMRSGMDIQMMQPPAIAPMPAVMGAG